MGTVLSVEKVYEFLKQYQIMALSTFGDFPWIANLYYVVEPDLRLYVFTNPNTIHCQHILNNPRVACAIYDSTQTPVQKKEFTKMGVQISGIARLLTDTVEMERGIDLWTKTLHVESPFYTVKAMKDNIIEGRIYEVRPHKIRLYDDTVFEEEHLPLLEL